MTELAVYESHNSLTEQMDYARAVSVASMLPDNYRNKPADIMLAVGLGQSMGLSPAESLYRIAVIKGKPTASAELVAANVRKAGHRLRVLVEPGKATATIIRADDPDFEFTVVRDSAWAAKMGLAEQPNYRKQGDTMLSWRAITAAARLACPEALYGVAYTADEMGDGDSLRATADDAGPAPAAQRMGAVLGTVTAEQVTDAQAPVADATASGGQIDSPLLNTSSKLAKAMFAAMGDVGITERDARLLYVSDVVGREVGSSSEMTEVDAHAVLDALAKDAQAAQPDDPALVEDNFTTPAQDPS